jgi:hypothetical protein
VRVVRVTAAYFGDNTNNINKLGGQNAELMCVNLAVHTVNSMLYEVKYRKMNYIKQGTNAFVSSHIITFF